MNARKVKHSKTNVKVNVLDIEYDFAIQPHTTGRQLFDQVAYLRDIRELWFFGLLYTDSKGVDVWLALKKKVFSQDVGKKRPIEMKFRIKFFPEDVGTELKDVNTQALFFLQVKQSLLYGEIYCPSETAVLLASYAAQAKHGDHSPKGSQGGGRMLDERLLPQRVIDQYDVTAREWEDKVESFYKDHMGMNRQEAIMEYLKIAQDLDMFGIYYFDIRNKKDTSLYLGIDAHGISVYERSNRLTPKTGFPWSEIRSISFSDKKFTIKTIDEYSPNLVFIVPRVRINKTILTLCMGNHELYEKRRKAEVSKTASMENGSQLSVSSPSLGNRQDAVGGYSTPPVTPANLTPSPRPHPTPEPVAPLTPPVSEYAETMAWMTPVMLPRFVDTKINHPEDEDLYSVVIKRQSAAPSERLTTTTPPLHEGQSAVFTTNGNDIKDSHPGSDIGTEAPVPHGIAHDENEAGSPPKIQLKTEAQIHAKQEVVALETIPAVSNRGVGSDRGMEHAIVPVNVPLVTSGPSSSSVLHGSPSPRLEDPDSGHIAGSPLIAPPPAEDCSAPHTFITTIQLGEEEQGEIPGHTAKSLRDDIERCTPVGIRCDIPSGPDLEERKPHLFQKKEEYKKVQNLAEDLSTQEKIGVSSSEDLVHKLLRHQGDDDKYKTLRGIRQGNTRSRISCFEAL